MPGVVFWCAAIVLLAIALSSHNLTLAALNAVLDSIYNSPDFVAYLTSISGKFLRSTREDFLTLLVKSVAVPAKKILFLLSVALLTYPVIKQAMRAEWLRNGRLLRSVLQRAALILLALAALIVPIGLRSLGDGYGRMSLAPYAEPAGLYSRRFFVPALAELFGFSGYLFYFIFSLLLTFLLIVLILLWLHKAGVEISFLPALSLCTSSFVIFSFEMPGYVDQFVFVLLLLMGILPLNTTARLGLAVMALATHELSIIALVPLFLFFGSWHDRKGMLILVASYVVLALVLNWHWADAVSQAHDAIPPKGLSPLQYFLNQPGLTVLGILASNKLLWLLPIITLFMLMKKGERYAAFSIAAIFVMPMLILPIAIDTSRLMGWGFIGMLLAMRYLMKDSAQQYRSLFLANILIPSVYVGLNTGVMWFPGLYRLLYAWL